MYKKNVVRGRTELKITARVLFERTRSIIQNGRLRPLRFRGANWILEWFQINNTAFDKITSVPVILQCPGACPEFWGHDVSAHISKSKIL